MPPNPALAGNGNRSTASLARPRWAVKGRAETHRTEGKSRTKNHILVDEIGVHLAVHVTAANEHDKWSADDSLFSIVIERPDPQQVEQHLCVDKGYDYEDVHQVVEQAQYEPRIKHCRRRDKPPEDACPTPDKLRYPARRWVVERTLSWLAKRRSPQTR